MDNWYVLRSVPGKEETAVELLRKTVDPELWDVCTVLKKQKLFRTDGKLILDTELMFPGFVFVKTDQMEKLAEVLERSREYPRPVGGKECPVRIEEEDLHFLQQVCGKRLDVPMGLSEVEADDEGNLIRVGGILKPYSGQIVRKRLRKRYVLAEVGLFGRQETILFGIRLPGDQIWQNDTKIQQQTFSRQ